jgi:hypothetical protein
MIPRTLQIANKRKMKNNAMSTIKSFLFHMVIFFPKHKLLLHICY